MPTPASSEGAPAFNGGTITDPLTVDSADATTQALTVDAGGANGKIARFRKSNGSPVLVVNSIFEAGLTATLALTAIDATFTLAATGNGFAVANRDGSNTNLFVQETGLVQIQPPAGSTDDPLDVRFQDGSTGLRVSQLGYLVFPGSHARVLAAGAFVTAQHAAPADADLAAGECALWFDQTNGVGNTKLMAKGKSADGTVKAATIVLA